MSGFALLSACAVLLVVFLLAFVLRTVRIARMPVHLRWELAPVPKEPGRARYGGSYLEKLEWWKAPREESLASEAAYVLEEVLTLKALREHNLALWWFSYPLHLGLYVLVVGAGLAAAAGAAGALGLGTPGFGLVSGLLPFLLATGYGLGALGALGLLARRATDPALRAISTPAAAFNLLLLLAMFATGLLASLSVEGFAGQAAALVRGLLTASPPGEVPGWLAAHALSACLFLAILPFTRMMHFVAKYFTYHQVRWEDAPLVAGGGMERELGALLGQSPTWSAPHVGADGKKTWVDIAVEKGVRR